VTNSRDYFSATVGEVFLPAIR